jgi:ABC-type transport system substrate-binding protein
VGAPDDDPAAQAAAQRLAGARAPLLDRVEIDVVEEAQPRWLAFLNGEHDVLTLPPEFAPLAVPGGQVAPFLAKRGVRAERALTASTYHTFLNCTDPDIGGLEPARVALRRAITLAYDSAEEIRLVHRGQSVPAQTLIPPGCYGFDAALKSEASTASAARANALLDLYGYADRNGDGWREHPDGRPLQLRMAFTPNSRSRAISELWLKRMKAVGLRIGFEFAPFGELIRKSLAGQVMMWGFSWGAPAPDGDFYLGLAYGPNAGQSNDSRFALPEFDRLYEQQARLPDGPERLALMRRATRLMLAYAPQIPHSHPLQTDLFQPHVQGPYRHLFNGDWYRWASVGGAAAG